MFAERNSLIGIKCAPPHLIWFPFSSELIFCPFSIWLLTMLPCVPPVVIIQIFAWNQNTFLRGKRRCSELTCRNKPLGCRQRVFVELLQRQRSLTASHRVQLTSILAESAALLLRGAVRERPSPEEVPPWCGKCAANEQVKCLARRWDPGFGKQKKKPVNCDS